MTYENQQVRLQSAEWALKGTSENVLKDSRFMKSFDIHLNGYLYIEQPISIKENEKPVLEAKGKVEYQVEGLKPKIFRAAPPFVLSGVINVIQEGVMDYTESQFTARFLKAFRAYLVKNMQKQIQQHSKRI